INSLRKIVAGTGFQEIFSHILTDKKSLISGIGVEEKDAATAVKKIVELDNFMSETYSAVRSSLLPGLLDVLARNKHADYPQKIFEEGIIAVREGGQVFETHSIALMSAHSKADFTEQKQHVSAILGSLGIQFRIQPAQHPAFLRGRVGRVVVNKTQIGSSRNSANGGMRNRTSSDLRLGPVAGATWEAVGVIGEISPAVLSSWGIEMPAAAIEIDLNSLALLMDSEQLFKQH
ncbi:MAG: hypothetical protein AABX60_04015, partial [Nanoarchaeota archaeon]